MKLKRMGILWLGLLLFGSPCWGQQKKSIIKAEEYDVKVAFIKNFFDFIKWPSNQDNLASDQLVFGIIGNTPFNDLMEKLVKNIKIPDKKVSVITIDDLVKVKECHVLIIGNIEAERLKEILSIIGTKPILSISDTEGFAEIGVLINFFKSENRVKFEINYSAVKRSGLSFSAKLYKVARLIDFPR